MKRIVPKSSAYPHSAGVIAIILYQNLFLWWFYVGFSLIKPSEVKKSLAIERTLLWGKQGEPGTECTQRGMLSQ